MASGEWVKMRINLSKVTSAVAMKRFLERDNAFIAWAMGEEAGWEDVTELPVTSRDIGVTRCAKCAVTFGLLMVWGAARIDGIVSGNDVILERMDLDAISEMAEVPSFGKAMEYAGWAQQLEGQRVLFPNCADHIFSSEETERLAAKERKRRQRERSSHDKSRDGHADVTPTGQSEQHHTLTSDVLKNMTLTELTDPTALLARWMALVAASIRKDCDDNRLVFFSMAAQAHAMGKKNACGLFVHLVTTWKPQDIRHAYEQQGLKLLRIAEGRAA